MTEIQPNTNQSDYRKKMDSFHEKRNEQKNFIKEDIIYWCRRIGHNITDPEEHDECSDEHLFWASSGHSGSPDNDKQISHECFFDKKKFSSDDENFHQKLADYFYQGHYDKYDLYKDITGSDEPNIPELIQTAAIATLVGEYEFPAIFDSVIVKQNNPVQEPISVFAFESTFAVLLPFIIDSNSVVSFKFDSVQNSNKTVNSDKRIPDKIIVAVYTRKMDEFSRRFRSWKKFFDNHFISICTVRNWNEEFDIESISFDEIRSKTFEWKCSAPKKYRQLRIVGLTINGDEAEAAAFLAERLRTDGKKWCIKSHIITGPEIVDGSNYIEVSNILIRNDRLYSEIQRVIRFWHQVAKEQKWTFGLKAKSNSSRVKEGFYQCIVVFVSPCNESFDSMNGKIKDKVEGTEFILKSGKIDFAYQEKDS